MTDTNEPNEKPQEQHDDKAGDILRKERVTKRITVETIAKDLKLNVSYIKALEANQYDALPADPYVRVYLRSIANYLMLNPEKILKRFYRDRGISPESQHIEREERASINLNQKSTGGPGWMIVLTLILALLALGYVAYRTGWIGPRQEITIDDQEGQEESFLEPTDDLREGLPNTLRDSLRQTDTTDTADTAADTATESSAQEPDSLRLTVSTVRDSVWIHVYSDGKSWRNFIFANRPRVFTAADSFNLRVGSNNRLEYTLNDEEISVPGSGVTAFKVDSTGVQRWRLSQWNRVFKGR